MDLGLADHTYIVTGGTRGLGRAVAEVLVAEGARVVISSRSKESVDDTVDALGSSAIGVAADNADPETPERLVAAARDRFGRLDGALISVGGPPAGPDLRTHRGRVARGLRLGVPRRAAAGHHRGGRPRRTADRSRSSSRRRSRAPIANLGISNGLRPGLAMAAKTLADELGPRGIRVNGLMPGRDRHRSRARARREHRRRGRRARRSSWPASRSGATASPRSSAARPRSCSPPPPAS